MLTKKQEALVNYLINRLGFEYSNFLIEYREKLNFSTQQFKNYRAIHPKNGEVIFEFTPNNFKTKCSVGFEDITVLYNSISNIEKVTCFFLEEEILKIIFANNNQYTQHIGDLYLRDGDVVGKLLRSCDNIVGSFFTDKRGKILLFNLEFQVTKDRKMYQFDQYDSKKEIEKATDQFVVKHADFFIRLIECAENKFYVKQGDKYMKFTPTKDEVIGKLFLEKGQIIGRFDKEIGDIVGVPGAPSEKHEFDGEKWMVNEYTVIDYLIDEYALKKNKNVLLVNRNNENLISATDMAMFYFCPASYSISKSFILKKTVSAEQGTDLHSESRLVKRLFKTKVETEEEKHTDFWEKENQSFFDDISSSKLLYSEHMRNEKKYFIHKGFVGQPDYVFEKPDGTRFIVEEKFKLKKSDQEHIFFNNHQIQLLSYIYGLSEFKADYGYLIYWYYNMSKNNEIVGCKVQKLKKTIAHKERLNKVFSSIRQFKTSKRIDFDAKNRRSNKCVNCVVSMYCAHKTGRFNYLKYPYSLEFYRLWPAEYPDILKKEKSNNDGRSFSNSQRSQNSIGTVESGKKTKNSYLTPEEQKNILNNLKW